MAGGTSESDSRAWLTAWAARLLVQRTMGGLIDNAQFRLVQWAADEIVLTRCQRWVFKSEDRGKHIENDVLIPSSFWDDMQVARRLSDWSNGAFEVIGYKPLYGRTETRIHGVEFCENDLLAHLDTLGRPRVAAPPTPPTPATTKVMGRSPPTPERKVKPVRATKNAPVTDVEIRAWFEALPTADQALGYRPLHAMAIRAFHPRKVVRKLVEGLTEGRPIGRRRGA
jgi:hypothetical protein